jgi:hypothetical protein
MLASGSIACRSTPHQQRLDMGQVDGKSMSGDQWLSVSFDLAMN